MAFGQRNPKGSRARRLTAVGFVGLVLLTGVGCGSSTGSHFSSRAVTEVADAARRARESPSGTAFFLDVRPREKYEAGHVAGAVWLNLAEWNDKSRSAQTGFDDVQSWRDRIGALGIEPTTSVVVYDHGEMVEAARVWFILQLFGAHNASVLNGGYPLLARQLASDRIAHGPPAAPTPRVFASGESDAAIVGRATKQRVRGVVESDPTTRAKPVVIWDARTEAEYTGLDARKNPRSGHLPGAVNLSHKKLLDEQGRLRPPAELRKLMADAGLRQDDTIITHCQSGGRAALAALAAVQAGYGDVSNYYMSFGEWAADETCPLVAPVTQPASRR